VIVLSSCYTETITMIQQSQLLLAGDDNKTFL
jgi:hypothetical protein